MLRLCGVFLVVAALVFLDQWSKHMALGALLERPFVVNDYLTFRVLYNHGIAFSLFSDHLKGSWLFAFFIGCVLIAIAYWLFKHRDSKDRFFWILVFCLAGGIGNFIDRLRFGYVIDFIGYHYGNWYFSVFNLADVCISLALGYFLLSQPSFFLLLAKRKYKSPN